VRVYVWVDGPYCARQKKTQIKLSFKQSYRKNHFKSFKGAKETCTWLETIQIPNKNIFILKH
jgi:hypothetical protein